MKVQAIPFLFLAAALCSCNASYKQDNSSVKINCGETGNCTIDLTAGPSDPTPDAIKEIESYCGDRGFSVQEASIQMSEGKRSVHTTFSCTSKAAP